MPPDLLKVRRIALFGENVHILYVAELAQNCMFLLLCGFPLGNPEKVLIRICKLQFLKGAKFAKYLIKEGELVFDRITGVS